jgi:preprotein translocase subunit SecE
MYSNGELLMLEKVKLFFAQVVSEARKITWLSRSETITSSIVVFVVVAIASLFFMLIDFGAYKIVNVLLNIGT